MLNTRLTLKILLVIFMLSSSAIAVAQSQLNCTDSLAFRRVFVARAGNFDEITISYPRRHHSYSYVLNGVKGDSLIGTYVNRGGDEGILIVEPQKTLLITPTPNTKDGSVDVSFSESGVVELGFDLTTGNEFTVHPGSKKLSSGIKCPNLKDYRKALLGT